MPSILKSRIRRTVNLDHAAPFPRARRIPGGAPALYARVCQPIRPPGYSNPVSGAVSGEASGAASGYRAGGPVGAVVGGAIGTATGTLTGTANMLSGSSPPPACARGYQLYNGHCYPNR
jgi:hypothetical protein